MSSTVAATRPQHVGICALEWYSPRTYVAQTSLEKEDGCEGKYTVGLGQQRMAFADCNEDVGSLLLSACARLLENYGIDPKSIGRLEVGTETLIDKSKSIKTSLLRLFEGNADLEGVTSVNACYGGTAALFNAVAWVESSAWDGRYAIVVCGDVAVYEKGPARPSGGCGAVAMLIGPDASLVLEPQRKTHTLDCWDFYKPKHGEYALVDGVLSQACYLRCVDACNIGLPSAASADYCVFHAPYNKLVRKAHARLALDPPPSCLAGDAAYEASLTDKGLDASLRKTSAEDYDKRVSPSTQAPQHIGNCYTASVFFGLVSLVSNAELNDKRIMVFSYGSGAVASMYVLRGRPGRFSLETMRKHVDLSARLAARVERSAAEFVAACDARERAYGTAPQAPAGAVPLSAGAFFLESVDDRHRRAYGRTPSERDARRRAVDNVAALQF